MCATDELHFARLRSKADHRALKDLMKNYSKHMSSYSMKLWIALRKKQRFTHNLSMYGICRQIVNISEVLNQLRWTVGPRVVYQLPFDNIYVQDCERMCFAVTCIKADNRLQLEDEDCNSQLKTLCESKSSIEFFVKSRENVKVGCYALWAFYMSVYLKFPAKKAF